MSAKHPRRQAPKASADISAPFALGWVLLSLGLFEVVTVLWIAFYYNLPGGLIATFVVLYLVMGFALWTGWKQLRTGLLEWTGDAWFFSGQPLKNSPHIAWDLQYGALIKIPDHGWVWLSAGTQPRERWLALRRALVF